MGTFLGVHFVPLWIPMRKRFQTFAAFGWMALFLGVPLFTIALFSFCLMTSYFWVVPLYLAWMFYDWETPNQGGRKMEWVKNWKMWEYFRDYFPIRLVKLAELDPKRNYLFGNHPHGVACAGAFASFGTNALKFREVFPGLRRQCLHVLPIFFKFPIFRELFLCGGLCSASKKSMEMVLGQPGEGHASILIPGGSMDMYEMVDPSMIKLYLKRRKGWIAMALRFGRDLVPSFTFGESTLYKIHEYQQPGNWYRRLQEQGVKKFGGLPFAFYTGRGVFQYDFGIVAKRQPVTVVVGEPIQVDKVENPTLEDIQLLQDRYIEAIMALYEKYNPIYGDTNIKLEIC